MLRTLHHALRENLPARSLLKSDFVVVNGLLARYHDLDGVTGDEFRKVALPPGSKRGSFLGMAAILAMGSDGERTSPGERGAWVLRKLLHAPTPPAPANVPQLSRLAGQLHSTRALHAAHKEQAQCAQCHRKMDPIGFGLENFDAVGQWRAEETVERTRRKVLTQVLEAKTYPIEPAGQLGDGTRFASYDDLRDLIAARADVFARGLVESLIAYGLDHPLSFADEPLVADILAQTKPAGHRLGDLVQAITQSAPFHHR